MLASASEVVVRTVPVTNSADPVPCIATSQTLIGPTVAEPSPGAEPEAWVALLTSTGPCSPPEVPAQDDSDKPRTSRGTSKRNRGIPAHSAGSRCAPAGPSAPPSGGQRCSVPVDRLASHRVRGAREQRLALVGLDGQRLFPGHRPPPPRGVD